MRVQKRSPWLNSLGVMLAAMALWGAPASADISSDKPGSVVMWPKVIDDGTRDTIITLTNTATCRPTRIANTSTPRHLRHDRRATARRVPRDPVGRANALWRRECLRPAVAVVGLRRRPDPPAADDLARVDRPYGQSVSARRRRMRHHAGAAVDPELPGSVPDGRDPAGGTELPRRVALRADRPGRQPARR